MDENKNLKELRTKISNRLLEPRKDKSGVELSRTLMEKGKGKSQLPHLCRWIKHNDYAKDDVEKVFRKYKDRYKGQRDGAGLKRDAGGRQKFERKKKKLLEKLDEF